MQDALQARLIETLSNKNQLFGSVSLQRTRRLIPDNVFGFVDSSTLSGVDAPINWSHRLTQFSTVRLRYQFTLLSTHTDAVLREPAKRLRRRRHRRQQPGSCQLGSAGADVLERHRRSQQRGVRLEPGIRRTPCGARGCNGRTAAHNLTAGGDLGLQRLDISSQQNARGTFTFTGAASGFGSG